MIYHSKIPTLHLNLQEAYKDLLPRFLDSSADWAALARVVPGGTMLPYTQAMTLHFDDLARKGVIHNLRDPSSRATTSEIVSDRILLALKPLLESGSTKEDTFLRQRVAHMEGMLQQNSKQIETLGGTIQTLLHALQPSATSLFRYLPSHIHILTILLQHSRNSSHLLHPPKV